MTGTFACSATLEVTDPNSMRANPPPPREPSTIMSASAPALRISSAGMP
jgi:hypothetical protein